MPILTKLTFHKFRDSITIIGVDVVAAAAGGNSPLAMSHHRVTSSSGT